ncbi:hypothetical protein [Apilactobacillus kunkeei]|uniref:Uncharacterized protein n=1 Tax=Apilactobacillus kunkeei TaxID=148814 RepID=A0AAC8ZY34_9LACO|nr:hypothetical protein [Apilactobacillus kunkeei]ALJ30794.1 hypothetical protein APS55_00430 [Apilactobacillus kunkeei]KFJ14619.1 hypothetical protein JI66_07185 [Apilactobacillus kunkeei]KOY69459.1 hypothetical protein RZ73_08510 [Apilactobacillus kunkeei]CAI2616876.1 hypothetical protein AKUH4B405J_09400 [Apilactobacillus kunkeei]CAI2618900.1 hypothetical protein AKUH4B410M_09400 [Apilactobacillus kunkeei]
MCENNLEDLSKSMLDLKNSLKDINGHTEIDMYEVLTDVFLSHYTDYSSINEFLDATGITDEDVRNYNNSPEHLDKIAQEYVKFESFGQFLLQASIDKKFIDHGFDLS